MKFYQIIVPVMFCFMYSATIFGSEKAYLDCDVYELMEEFVDLYKETAHVKPYPPFLRKLQELRTC